MEILKYHSFDEMLEKNLHNPKKLNRITNEITVVLGVICAVLMTPIALLFI